MSGGPAGPDIAIFLRNLAGGGIERVMLLLAGAFVQDGLAVELIVGERRGARADEVPAGVTLVELRPGSVAAGRLAALRADPSGLPTLAAPVLLARKVAPTLAFLPGLARRLRAHPPRALLAATPFENLEALRARRLTGGRFRVVLSEHNQIDRSLIDSREWSRRCLPALMRRAYPEAEAIVAVSNGVAEEIARLAALPRARITTIYNPIVTPDLPGRAAGAVGEPWLAPGEPPVVMGAGRLVRQKDFPTLIRAFALARRQRPMRLLIAGGADTPASTAKRQAELMALAGELGVAQEVRLTGHLADPLPLMARAALFVLSSAWEGLGNVLVEAMACGTPVVSTDCPSGPAEILENGRHGRLVPVGDPAALAEAILATLTRPPDAASLRRRAQAFTVANAASAYRALLLGEAGGGAR
ncbi:MAG: glycosyltransferase [Geminicoccaceae bacterium]